jgi:hypothetical protein
MAVRLPREANDWSLIIAMAIGGASAAKGKLQVRIEAFLKAHPWLREILTPDDVKYFYGAIAYINIMSGLPEPERQKLYRVTLPYLVRTHGVQSAHDTLDSISCPEDIRQLNRSVSQEILDSSPKAQRPPEALKNGNGPEDLSPNRIVTGERPDASMEPARRFVPLPSRLGALPRWVTQATDPEILSRYKLPAKTGETKTTFLIIGLAMFSELTSAYDILRESKDGRTAEELLKQLGSDTEGRHYLRTPEEMMRGLQWLEMNGFPLRKVGAKWEVSGLAREWNFSLEMTDWPMKERLKWRMLGKSTSGKAVGQRIRLLVNVISKSTHRKKEIIWAEMGELLSRQTGTHVGGIHIRSLVAAWCTGLHEPTFDKLSEVSAWLGVELCRLRTGQSRWRAWTKIERKVRSLSEAGKRFQELRIWAGKSYPAVSDDLRQHGIELSERALREFESGVYKVFMDVRVWRYLAESLGVSPYRIPAGVETREEAFPLYTVGARIQLMQWVLGIPTKKLARKVSVNTATLQHWMEDEFQPRGEHRRLLVQALGDIPEDELFTPACEGARKYVQRYRVPHRKRAQAPNSGSVLFTAA